MRVRLEVFLKACLVLVVKENSLLDQRRLQLLHSELLLEHDLHRLLALGHTVHQRVPEHWLLHLVHIRVVFVPDEVLVSRGWLDLAGLLPGRLPRARLLATAYTDEIWLRLQVNSMVDTLFLREHVGLVGNDRGSLAMVSLILDSLILIGRRRLVVRILASLLKHCLNRAVSVHGPSNLLDLDRTFSGRGSLLSCTVDTTLGREPANLADGVAIGHLGPVLCHPPVLILLVRHAMPLHEQMVAVGAFSRFDHDSAERYCLVFTSLDLLDHSLCNDRHV